MKSETEYYVASEEQSLAEDKFWGATPSRMGGGIDMPIRETP